MKRITKDPDIRRQEIIKAARYLFLSNEYEGTSVKNIVDYLGIAKGTIYHYFSSKEELLEAVVEDIVEEDNLLKKRLIGQMQGNALEKIRQLVELDSLAVRYDPILRTLHQPGNIGLHARLLALSIIKESLLYADLIQQGVDEGLFDTTAPLECAEFMISAMQFLTDIGIYPWHAEDLIRRVRAFPALIEKLLKAQEGSFNFLLSRFNVE